MFGWQKKRDQVEMAFSLMEDNYLRLLRMADRYKDLPEDLDDVRSRIALLLTQIDMFHRYSTSYFDRVREFGPVQRRLYFGSKAGLARVKRVGEMILKTNDVYNHIRLLAGAEEVENQLHCYQGLPGRSG